MADLVDEIEDERMRPNSGRDVDASDGASLATDRSDCDDFDLRRRPKKPEPDDVVVSSLAPSADYRSVCRAARLMAAC